MSLRAMTADEIAPYLDDAPALATPQQRRGTRNLLQTLNSRWRRDNRLGFRRPRPMRATCRYRPECMEVR